MVRPRLSARTQGASPRIVGAALVVMAKEHFVSGVDYEIWWNPKTTMVTLAADDVQPALRPHWDQPYDELQMDWIKDGFVVGGGTIQ